MKRGRMSLRGCGIGLLGCNEQDGATLSRQLSRLGAVAVTLTAIPETGQGGAGDLAALILDGDSEYADQPSGADLGRALPVVALLGSEAPSSLQRVARLSISGYLMKPARSFGVMAALSFARQNFVARRDLEAKADRLEERLRRRRFVVAAQLGLMREYGLSEADAFERLRGAAMERRTTIEAISVDLVAGATCLPPPRRSGRGRRGDPGLGAEGD
ncbi:MAG: hypothetical protein DI556_08870 [Rhodovulum sulfidophilum]|uniref:ANTAR domain-containing protein n=1 Tax=Rhodovulum sulfidophilum TaxID=35806 RepID=A0A2W5ND45_RHOSU|nr:MAG: hypothetical protein DI556_08870 [Rhodovulum sulfidophilum]